MPVMTLDVQEEEEEELQLEDDANVFNAETRMPLMGAGVDEGTARCQCRWDNPEAWLVQSDSIDEVSVAAMV